MHIGFSLLDLAIGGAQLFFTQLAKGLNERGHQISYYLHARRDDPRHTSIPLVEAMNQAARPVKSPRDILECDVIHLDGYHSIRRKLYYLPGWKRCVETYHSAYSIKRSGPLFTYHRVAISKAVQNMLKRRSQVIYCGIPLPPMPLSQPKEFDIAILGRIHPIKGHLLFLKACESLYQQRRTLKALIIGGHTHPCSYQQQVDQEITRLKNQGLQIHLTGEIPPEEVYDWLLRSRILLVTSQDEGFGRMAVEAMACQLPVVANPVGGLLEIIQDQYTGYFASRDDPLSFASLANFLLDNQLLCNEFGQQGRRVAETYFSYDAMIEAYECLYKEMMPGK